MTRIKKVLLACDFSAHSERAASVAADLCRRYAASATVLYVWQSELLALYDSLPLRGISELQDYPSRFVPALDGVCRQLRACGVLDVDMALIEGAPAATITRFAQEGHFDLIVMGTHGRTGLSRAFLGSVAEEVVRTAPCAVVTNPLEPAGESVAPEPPGAASQRFEH